MRASVARSLRVAGWVVRVEWCFMTEPISKLDSHTAHLALSRRRNARVESSIFDSSAQFFLLWRKKIGTKKWKPPFGMQLSKEKILARSPGSCERSL